MQASDSLSDESASPAWISVRYCGQEQPRQKESWREGRSDTEADTPSRFSEVRAGEEGGKREITAAKTIM